jgi:predicted AlkP superfamily phosphohydrolase/phosphomutase
MTEERSNTKAFVLGLDGIPWNLLEKWARSGDLPNFERLLSEGASGPLDSSRPATTPVAWPSIATGVWPDKHGVYEFMQLTPQRTKEPYTRNDVRAPALWDYLEPAVVANVPMTYPPAEIDGKLVTGMMTPGTDEQFTHPPELSARIREEIPDYQVGLNWSNYWGEDERFLEDLDSLVESRRALLDMLMETEDWRLFFFVFTAPDRLQHLIWEESQILQNYRQMDRILGDVLDYCESRDANLFVVSDHGFGPISRVVYPNAVLAESGFLSRTGDGGSRQLLSSVGVSRSKVEGWLDSAGVDVPSLVRRLPDRLVDSVAEQIPGGHELYDVDFDETSAFFTGPGSIYINDADRFDDGIVPKQQVDAVREELVDLFSNLTDPETGERPLDVYDGSEFYPNDPDSPDVLLSAREGYNVKVALQDEQFGRPDQMLADHRNEGIFLAYGPDVDAGTNVDDATLVDVAPTLLHSVGEPVPESGDGDVLKRIFADGTSPATQSVQTREDTDSSAEADVSEDFDDVEDRLRGLGYME